MAKGGDHAMRGALPPSGNPLHCFRKFHSRITSGNF
jgi:hypothetical protein